MDVLTGREGNQPRMRVVEIGSCVGKAVTLIVLVFEPEALSIAVCDVVTCRWRVTVCNL